LISTTFINDVDLPTLGLLVPVLTKGMMMMIVMMMMMMMMMMVIGMMIVMMWMMMNI
jgi:hypothetical protein